jgi:curved DNA-binding protein CbpA
MTYSELTHYQLLGVAINVTPKEISRAYKRLALRHHPDKGGEEGLFKALVNAYEILSDSEKRECYNRLLAADYGMDIEATIRHAREKCYKQQQQQKEQDERSFYSNPDADFTTLSKEEQRYIDKYHRRDLYAINGFRTQDSIDASTTILPKTKASFKKHRNKGMRDIFMYPDMLKRAQKYGTTMLRPYQAYDGFRAAIFDDLLQPLHGIGNLFIALIFVICWLSVVILAPLIVPIVYIVQLYQGRDSSKELVSITQVMIIGASLSFINFAAVGLSQLVMAPITWLVVLPCRSIISLHQGTEPIEQSNNIQRLIQEAEAGLGAGDKAVLRATTALIHIKFNYDINHKKRYTSLSPNAEFKTFQALETEFVLSTLNPLSVKPITEQQKRCVTNYLCFFKPTLPPQELIPPASTDCHPVKNHS